MDTMSDNIQAVRFILFFAGLIIFFAAELFCSYRSPGESKFSRWITNLSTAGINSLALNILFSAMIAEAGSGALDKKYGLLNRLDLPFLLKLISVILIMDLMLYVWHLLNHVVPFLWRFHRVHHSDLNMDVSTATRFHAGELMISALIKIGLMNALGIDLIQNALFESAIVLAAQIQHSSIKVPAAFERAYILLFVPPSMHRVHHSVIIRERNSNYGTIFSIWDRLFRTLKMNVDQEKLKIGMGTYRDPAELGIINLLLMPFTKSAR